MSEHKMSDILKMEMKRRYLNLTQDLDRLIDELQTARRRLDPEMTNVPYLNSSITRDAGEVLRLTAEYTTYQNMHAVALKLEAKE